MIMESFPANGLAHIGIPCLNLDRSIAFYQLLGFSAMARKNERNGYHVAMLRNGSCTIELYEAVDPREKEACGSRPDGRIDHIALKCGGDLDSFYQRVCEIGIPLASTGIETTQIWEQPCRYFILRGPDGERVEISEL